MIETIIEFSLFSLLVLLMVSILPMSTSPREKVIPKSKKYYFLKIFRWQMIIFFIIWLIIFIGPYFPRFMRILIFNSEVIGEIIGKAIFISIIPKYVLCLIEYLIISFMKILTRLEHFLYGIPLFIATCYAIMGLVFYFYK